MQVTMSLSHLLKSRLAQSTLRRQEGSFFSAALNRATPFQCSKIRRTFPYTKQPYPFSDAFKPYRDALYNDAGIALIVFPLLASCLTLPLLARYKYIHDISEWYCEQVGIEASGEKFEYRKSIYAHRIPLYSWLSPFFHP